jgi:hypothetical protein
MDFQFLGLGFYQVRPSGFGNFPSIFFTLTSPLQPDLSGCGMTPPCPTTKKKYALHTLLSDADLLLYMCSPSFPCTQRDGTCFLYHGLSFKFLCVLIIKSFAVSLEAAEE